MGFIGRLISTRIDNYILGVIEKRKGYNLEPAFFGPAGIDARPLPGDKQYCGSQDGSEKYVILGSLMISQGAKEGELILYSRDSNGNIKSKVYLNQAGEIVFNDGTDFGVAFNRLKTEFDKLNSSFNSHTHVYAPGPGSPVPTATALPQSTALIDNTKVEKVRLL